MNVLSTLLVIIALNFSLAAHAAPPTDQSVEKLLDLSKAGKLIDSVWSQMDQIMSTSMKQAMKGKPVTPEAQAIIDKQQGKIIALMKQELSWDKLKPGFVQVYKQTYTQEEVDGLIAFYQSPTGQAFVNKQPALMKNTMTLMQAEMGPLMEKMQKISEETATEIQSAQQDK